ncbi:MAG: hypothetical protein ACKOE6_08105 [Flammeovirgaceae bacterium]
MNQLLQDFVKRAYPYFSKVEVALWAGFVVGFVLKSFDAPADNIVMISASLLAILYFLPASLPFTPESIDSQKQSPPLLESLYNTIVHKASGIGLASAVIGILFYGLGRKGYSEMLLLGAASTALVTVLVLAGAAMNNTKKITVLYRSLPLLLVSLYLLFSDGYFG